MTRTREDSHRQRSRIRQTLYSARAVEHALKVSELQRHMIKHLDSIPVSVCQTAGMIDVLHVDHLDGKQPRWLQEE